MLIKLAINNMKKSIKDYLIYFLTLVLSVMVFYTFNSLGGQKILEGGSIGKQQTVSRLMSVISYFSLFIALLVGFLVSYANKFIMKRRHKEFGIYMILGMTKKKISLILTIETVCMGFLSIITGLVLGVLASGGVSVIVSNVFEVTNADYSFDFSMAACLKTIIYFVIIYVVVVLMNIWIISRSKLIDLLRASKRNQEIKIKNNLVCALVFCLALGGNIWASIQLLNLKNMKVSFGIIIVATVAIFWSVSGFILKVCMKAKNMYFKGINSFTTRQISSKINTTVGMLATISLLLCMSISLLSASYTYKQSLAKGMEEILPVDVFIRNPISEYEKEECGIEDDVWVANKDKDIRQQLKESGFDYENNFKYVLSMNIYKSNEVTCDNIMGKYVLEFLKGYKQDVVRVSDYNRVAELYGWKKVSLDRNEYAIVSNDLYYMETFDMALKDKLPIIINNNVYNPKYTKCVEGFIELSSQKNNRGFVVVPDIAVNGMDTEFEVMLANYNADTEEGKLAIEDKVNKTAFFSEKNKIGGETKIFLYDYAVGESAMVVFVAMYMGIILIIVSAAILAINSLADCSDSIEKYRILRKIGVEEKMINKSLLKQIVLFFAVPFSVAILNGIVGIKILTAALNQMTPGMDFDGISVKPIGYTVIVLCILYGGYMFATYISSKRIIKE